MELDASSPEALFSESSTPCNECAQYRRLAIVAAIGAGVALGVAWYVVLNRG